MKRLLSLLLGIMMLIACATACAEATRYEEFGFAIDFDAIKEKCANHPFLLNYGVVDQDPFVAEMLVGYSILPENVVETIEDIMESTDDEAEYNDFKDLLTYFIVYIGDIIVTDAEDLVEAGCDASALETCEVTEFGTLGDHHYFFLAMPLEGMLSVYDEAEDTGDYEVSPQEMKAAALEEIRMVQSGVLELLRAAELSEPVNAAEEFIGQTIEFESVDLDGNVVRSADLFRDNGITMVNLWGTWCSNCLNEMDELAEIHKRMQEKGCGIVGVEFERDAIGNVADTTRKVFADNGVTYPNVILPEGNPIFEQVHNYPFSFFVDSEGRIITYPIKGAAVEDYEPTFEKLLAGEAIEKSPETGSTANGSGEYRVIVYDTEGNPVKGVIVQLCDESTCSFQKTKEDGVATFQVEAPKVYDVHVGKVPEGYVSSDETCKTLDTYCDVNIFISKAE